MTASKLILVDLDRTLFDSDRFYIDICKGLAKVGKLSQAQLAEAISLLSDPEAMPYVTDLVERFQLDEAGIEKVLKHQLVPNHYLYEDVAEFIERIKQQRLAIITTGIERYQQFKFEVSPLLGSATAKIISERNKGQWIKQRLKYQNNQVGLAEIREGEWFEEFYLIDDRNYNLNALAGVEHATLFHIRRPSEKAGDNKLADGVRVITSLKEVQ